MTPRDTHGRGIRRPLFPPGSPGYRTRAEVFDEVVIDASERLQRMWGATWGKVEFGVEDIPPSEPSPWERGVPLGRLFPSEYGAPNRIVLYRRPIEQRASSEDLAGLVRDILAEHVGHVLGRRPDEVDPDYGSGA